MKNRTDYKQNSTKKSKASRAFIPSKRKFRHGASLSQRTRGVDSSQRHEFSPPENWYEPEELGTSDYSIIVQSPGRGYRHVVTPDDIRERLNELPESALYPLEVVQLSRMTRKKQSFPCYGMQWGTTLYLYPIEDTLIEYYSRPPRPAQYNEAKMYGGRWIQEGTEWQLVWTESTIRDFYLNNILIHELGHLLDDRNTSYQDRERYAEWFAIEHGFKKSPRRHTKSRPIRDQVRRRHHTE